MLRLPLKIRKKCKTTEAEKCSHTSSMLEKKHGRCIFSETGSSRRTMKTAISADKDQIALSLGKTHDFFLLEGESVQRVTCSGNIPLQLKREGVDCLICNGIGNCMLELLSAMQIRVIPGVSGSIENAIESFHAGTLRRGTAYSCADNGKTCGSCPGVF
jgi:predicted Fe-Mo cluster-binding NifX family protein